MVDLRLVDLINKAYSAFNARKIDEVLAVLAPDVEWANGMDGGFIYGHQAVREYWTKQWGMINPHVTPLSFDDSQDGRIDITVRQVVLDLNGNKLADNNVIHSYLIHDDKIISMLIKPVPQQKK